MMIALQLVLALWLQETCIGRAEVAVVDVHIDQMERWEAPSASLPAIEALEEVEGPEKHSKCAIPDGVAHGFGRGYSTAWQRRWRTVTAASRDRWSIQRPRGPPAV